MVKYSTTIIIFIIVSGSNPTQYSFFFFQIIFIYLFCPHNLFRITCFICLFYFIYYIYIIYAKYYMCLWDKRLKHQRIYFLLINIIHVCIEKRNKMFKQCCEFNYVNLVHLGFRLILKLYWDSIYYNINTIMSFQFKIDHSNRRRHCFQMSLSSW